MTIPLDGVDEHRSDRAWAGACLRSVVRPLIITGESRSSLATHLRAIMLKHNPNWKVPANENLYVFYGRFWRGFGDATKGIVHHDNVANLMKDSMVGDLVPVIAKTVSRKRHFIYL